jgi:pimeloyl-ACP methyl ester carboxylesterase
VLAGHSSGGIYTRIFAARFPDEVAGMVLLDAQPPEAFTRLPGYPGFYKTFKWISALLPSLARMGVVRTINQFEFGSLPAQARDEERASWSSARLNRNMRDEFLQLPGALEEARTVESIGAMPLIVVTAVREAQEGWLPLQEAMVRLSTNSVHRLVPDATHASLILDKKDSAASSQAVLDVVDAARTATGLAKHQLNQVSNKR